MNKPNYGIDAPGVVRTLEIVGVIAVLLGVFVAPMFEPSSEVLAAIMTSWLRGAGMSLLLSAFLMILSSKVGKLRERDRLLDSIQWRGDERVLDVGCGRGLLLIGAARRLNSGTAVGIDLWQTSDQSGNSPETTMANARAEGVTDRIELITGDARALPFDDESFDVVVSNLALHNIPDAAGRATAVREIARVLKPGGALRISDFKNTADYLATLRQAGWSDAHRSGLHFLIFPPVRIVSATTPTRPR